MSYFLRKSALVLALVAGSSVLARPIHDGGFLLQTIRQV